MNCIFNLLNYGSSILSTAMVNISSLCNSKEESVMEPKPRPPARIPRMIVTSLERRSLIGLATAVSKAGGFDYTRSLTYVNDTSASRFGDTNGSSQNEVLIRRVDLGGHADVGRSVSARGFYN